MRPFFTHAERYVNCFLSHSVIPAFHGICMKKMVSGGRHQGDLPCLLGLSIHTCNTMETMRKQHPRSLVCLWNEAFCTWNHGPHRTVCVLGLLHLHVSPYKATLVPDTEWITMCTSDVHGLFSSNSYSSLNCGLTFVLDSLNSY